MSYACAGGARAMGEALVEMTDRRFCASSIPPPRATVASGDSRVAVGGSPSALQR